MMQSGTSLLLGLQPKPPMDKFERFEAWLRENGALFENLELREYDDATNKLKNKRRSRGRKAKQLRKSGGNSSSSSSSIRRRGNGSGVGGRLERGDNNMVVRSDETMDDHYHDEHNNNSNHNDDDDDDDEEEDNDDDAVEEKKDGGIMRFASKSTSDAANGGGDGGGGGDDDEDEEESEMRGVHAKRYIPPNSVCMVVPRKCLITVEMGQATPLGQAILNSNLDLDAPKHIFLMIYLLWDRRVNGTRSFFHPYYDILPRTLRNMPIFWNARELSLLRGSYLLAQIADRNEAIADDYHAIASVCPELRDLCTLDEFKWARMCVCSRNFGLQMDGHRTSALVPHADMLNHYRPRETKWTFDEERQAFTITTLQGIPAGAQVYDSYGMKCNHRFLLNYGFVPEVNTELDGFCPNEVPLELSVPLSDPLYEAKVDFWTRGDVSPSSPSGHGGHGAGASSSSSPPPVTFLAATMSGTTTTTARGDSSSPSHISGVHSVVLQAGGPSRSQPQSPPSSSTSTSPSSQQHPSHPSQPQTQQQQQHHNVYPPHHFPRYPPTKTAAAAGTTTNTTTTTTTQAVAKSPGRNGNHNHSTNIPWSSQPRHSPHHLHHQHHPTSSQTTAAATSSSTTAAAATTTSPAKRVRICVSNNENTRLLFSLLRVLACNEEELAALTAVAGFGPSPTVAPLDPAVAAAVNSAPTRTFFGMSSSSPGLSSSSGTTTTTMIAVDPTKNHVPLATLQRVATTTTTPGGTGEIPGVGYQASGILQHSVFGPAGGGPSGSARSFHPHPAATHGITSHHHVGAQQPSTAALPMGGTAAASGPASAATFYQRSCRDVRHPISLRNERAAMNQLVTIVSESLNRYPTTLAQDAADLMDEASYPRFSNERHAKIQVRGEKEVLTHYLTWAQTALQVLTVIEQEIRVKMMLSATTAASSNTTAATNTANNNHHHHAMTTNSTTPAASASTMQHPTLNHPLNHHHPSHHHHLHHNHHHNHHTFAPLSASAAPPSSSSSEMTSFDYLIRELEEEEGTTGMHHTIVRYCADVLGSLRREELKSLARRFVASNVMTTTTTSAAAASGPSPPPRSQQQPKA